MHLICNFQYYEQINYNYTVTIHVLKSTYVENRTQTYNISYLKVIQTIVTINCELPTQTKFDLWYVYVGALVPYLIWITFHELQAHKL